MSLAVLGISFAGNDDKKSENTVANKNLSGKVVDKINGEALAGVKVQIDGTDQVVYTDFDGNFQFSNIQPGNYSIKVVYLSYETSLLKDVVAGQEMGNFKVELKPLEL